jgi:hypothetical protein
VNRLRAKTRAAVLSPLFEGEFMPKMGFASFSSRLDRDDDSDGHGHIIDFASYTWSATHGAIDLNTGSYAKGGKPGGPGGGGGGGGTPLTPTDIYISGDPTKLSLEFNIKIVFQGTWDPALKQAFTVSADALSTYITGDIPDYVLNGQFIDDITITASLVAIDGTGGILGQAGPDYVRTPSYLPLTATMQFDSADAAYFNGLHLFDDIVFHEMTHSIGFGSIWGYKNLVTAGKFNGVQANTAYHNEVPGSTGGVPVETTGGRGTAGSHWSEAVFNDEIMTGWIDNDNHLTYMTVASLGDLGYSVVDSGGFTPPTFI